MASLTRGKNAKGTYWDVRWRDPVTGVHHRKRLRTREMADRWHAEALKIESHGVELAHLRHGSVTLGWVIDEWWDWKYPRLAPNTRSTWTSAQTHIPKALRERPIRHITTPDIDVLLDEVAQDSGYDAAKTLRTVLSNIVKYALKHSYLTSNPVADADTPKPERRGGASKVKAVDPKLVPSPEEVLRVAAEIAEPYRALVMVMGFGGLRPGEAFALHPDDLDFEEGRIYVRGSQSSAPRKHSYTGETREINDPKTGPGFREVDIPVGLVQVLKTHMAEYYTGGDRVFTTPSGTPIHPSNFRNREFSKAVKAAGVTVPCTPRDLRRTAASIMISSDIDAARVAAQLGHSDASVALKIYAGFWRRKDSEVADALEAAMKGQVKRSGHDPV